MQKERKRSRKFMSTGEKRPVGSLTCYAGIRLVQLWDQEAVRPLISENPAKTLTCPGCAQGPSCRGPFQIGNEASENSGHDPPCGENSENGENLPSGRRTSCGPPLLCLLHHIPVLSGRNFSGLVTCCHRCGAIQSRSRRYPTKPATLEFAARAGKLTVTGVSRAAF